MKTAGKLVGVDGKTVDKMTNKHMSSMESKLANGDVRFTDNYWSDFKFYLYNNHILLAVFCSHHENPNNKGARLLAFLSSNVFAMFLASISALTDPNTR